MRYRILCVAVLLSASLRLLGGELEDRVFAAFRCGETRQVQGLIEKGADVNARSAKGETPLSMAEGNNRAANADLLRKHGATR